jgi:hypothetical protein
MTQRESLSEMVWPDDPEDAQTPVKWAESMAVQVLDWAWRGFDAVYAKYLSSIELSLPPPEQFERDLGERHFSEILLLWKRETDGFPSLLPIPESPELENRSSASAKPLAYDFCFVHIENQRWKWPLEAKVLLTSKRTSEYLEDVRRKFMTGKAAPFVGEGGMIGYLLSGSAEEAFAKIGEELQQELLIVEEFSARSHRASQHARTTAPRLRLHHMIMNCARA